MMGNAQFSTRRSGTSRAPTHFSAMAGDEDKRVKNPDLHPLRHAASGVCPMHLTAGLHEHVCGKQEDLDSAVDGGMMSDCIECGSCAYVCPARIPLVQQFRVAKMRVQEKRRAEAAAAKAAAENK